MRVAVMEFFQVSKFAPRWATVLIPLKDNAPAAYEVPEGSVYVELMKGEDWVSKLHEIAQENEARLLRVEQERRPKVLYKDYSYYQSA